MTTQADDDVLFIWVTRGRTWGFRFLRTGGRTDPLSVYEAVFSEIGDQPAGWCQVTDKVGLRFPDPDGRQDVAGRVISHDSVLLGRLAVGISSLDDGRRRIWPEVADEFERVWDRPEGPSGVASPFDDA